MYVGSFYSGFISRYRCLVMYVFDYRQVLPLACVSFLTGLVFIFVFIDDGFVCGQL